MSAADEHQQIIIVKRGHDDHDDHHGGAWKIAFADFMTAMMALFLVLWLVNAANEETRQSVASYFNPVKLVDRNRSVRGLYDAQGMQEVEVQSANDLAATGEDGLDATSTTTGGQSEHIAQGEAAFFTDPFNALEEIASAYEPDSAADPQEQSGFRSWSTDESQANQQTFLDPFAPERWTDPVREAPEEQLELSDALAGTPQTGGAITDVQMQGEQLHAAPSDEEMPEAASDAAANAQIAAEDVDPLLAAIPPDEDALTPPPHPDLSVEAVAEQGELVEAVEQPDGAEPVANEMAAVDAEPAPTETDPGEVLRNEAEELRTELTEALQDAFGSGTVVVEQLSVEAQKDAILISLTDNLQIPMFEIGSAVPSPPLVVALERVGGVIGQRAGGIRIEGHTDARPFAAGTGDNWQLSSSRAQAAFYMLVRGGVSEERIKQVSGRADRSLAVPDDPFSARNRRIDILLELGE